MCNNEKQLQETVIKTILQNGERAYSQTKRKWHVLFFRDPTDIFYKSNGVSEQHAPVIGGVSVIV